MGLDYVAGELLIVRPVVDGTLYRDGVEFFGLWR